MSSPNTNQLIHFSVDRLMDNSTTDFDVFIRISDHLILYGASGYRWFRRELTDLLRNGVQEFLIRSEDQSRAKMYTQIHSLPAIEKNLPPAQRIINIEQIGSEFTKALYSGEITPATIEKAKTIADSLLDCIAEDKRCVQALTMLGDHDYYTYSHSMRVASFSVVIAMNMGLTDVDQLKEIVLGSMLHDLGKKDVPLYLINKPGALTEDEWKVFKAHPESGHQWMSGILKSTVPSEIILHHHEKNDGSGYPHGLDRHSLLPEVQIATMADVFDALTSSRSYQNKRSRFEALDFIRHNMLGVKLSKEPFQALVASLVA